jgi:hypothetical protein
MKRAFCSLSLFCISASPAFAGLDWGFISTAGDPDFVTVFDLADPAPSRVDVGQVATNFNRGMDYYNPNAFYYYVSTDSLNSPGERGLWKWDNNVNTQLFNHSFNDSTDGDATLSNDLSKFYVTTSDGTAPAGHSLYVFDNLGGAVTFTEVGKTNLNQIIGLAMDPLTGILYGYDSSTEALYTISTADASATLVGASGLSLGAIGGMDFSADGSTLLLSVAGDLYTVNKNNGQLTAAGDVIDNVSALSYRIPEPSALALLGLGGLFILRRR